MPVTFDAECGRCSSCGLDSFAEEVGGDCREPVAATGVIVVAGAAATVPSNIVLHGDVALLDLLLLMAVAPRPTVAALPMVDAPAPVDG